MEKVLRIILPIAAIVLVVLVFNSIAGPVKEQKKIDVIETRIKERLLLIKDAQFVYRDKYNFFAPDFDVLINALKNDKVAVIRQEGDPEDTLSVVTIDTSFVPMHVVAFGVKEINLDSLPFVPMNPDNVKFTMKADTITLAEVRVPVFLVEDPAPYNKKRALRIGSLTDAVYGGNWE